MNIEEIIKNRIGKLFSDDHTKMTDLYELLKEKNAIIAGGVITSIVSGQDINDIDIYFRSEEDFKEVLGTVYQNYFLTLCFATEKSATLTNGESHIQLIRYRWFKDVEDIFSDFDFTCCMGAFDLKTEEVILHKDMMKDIAARRLIFTGNTKFPISTLGRINKYQTRGYSINRNNLMKIGYCCSNVNIESWDDVENQIGGMYGLIMDKDKLPPFSLEYLFNNLESIFTEVPPQHFNREDLKRLFNIEIDYDFCF